MTNSATMHRSISSEKRNNPKQITVMGFPSKIRELQSGSRRVPQILASIRHDLDALIIKKYSQSIQLCYRNQDQNPDLKTCYQMIATEAVTILDQQKPGFFDEKTIKLLRITFPDSETIERIISKKTKK